MRALAAFTLALCAAACGAPAERPHESARHATTSSADAELSRPAHDFAPEALFKDDIEVTHAELASGRTNCRDILKHPDLSAIVVPWPARLKEFLVAELERFPLLGHVENSVEGLYLVKGSALKLSTGSSAAGLACDRGSDLKGVIFLNYDSFVTRRQSAPGGKGIGSWTDDDAVTDRFILMRSGDNAALTLIHEILHAIDNKLFMNGQNELRARRMKVMDVSWKSFTEPRADRISVFALGSSTKAAAEIATEMRYLAEDTNFIVPYAMASPAEDFAESLTVYYFGAERKSWQVRAVYDAEIGAEGPGDATRLYLHDTRTILKNSAKQRDKLCGLAMLVFGECEL